MSIWIRGIQIESYLASMPTVKTLAPENRGRNPYLMQNSAKSILSEMESRIYYIERNSQIQFKK